MTDPRAALDAANVDAWLIEAFDRLSRGHTDTLDAYLECVVQPFQLEGTRATVRSHFVITDANGFPRVGALCKQLAGRIVDYCIPRSRINAAHEELVATGSTEPFIKLGREAKDLFTKLEKSGEGGELLLYSLIETMLGIPQILCKMPLKTSSQMHVHGTDGLHAKLLENGKIALYWGESKIHATAKSAIDDCFESLAPFLQGELSDVRDRDLLLLRDNLDLGDRSVTDALVRYFISDNPEAGRVEFRGACLVGFTHSDYPSVASGGGAALNAEIENALTKWHNRLTNRIKHFSLSSLHVEVFCMPVPSADDFRKKIRESLDLN